MDPFARKQTRKRDNKKLAMMILAGASFSVWFFDLMPVLDPVSTGSLDFDITDPSLDEADFIAMLEPPANTVNTADQPAGIPEFTDSQDDPLLSAIAAQSEPAESSLTEFSDEAATTHTAFNADTAGNSVQQVSFERSQPTDVHFEPADAVLPADVAAHLRDVDQWLESGDILEAHAALSRLYWKKPELRSFINQRLQKTAVEIYANSNSHFAEPHTVEFGETLQGIGQQYNVPWQYLANLNGVTPKTLQAGRKLKVLKGPFSAVVDLNRFQLTIHAHGWYVHHYRIGVGHDQRTPVGEFTVQNKLQNPTWYDPAGGVVDADDPANPLGEYWLGLGDHIGIHGTIDPDSIGKAVSRGCIHMADGDIDEVFQLLGEGSAVVIRN